MTTIVSPELVERAWRRIAALDASAALKLQNRSGKFQPELVGFVLGFTHDLSREGMGIALYAMLVLFEMFQQVPATRFTKVKDAAIMQSWPANRGLGTELLKCEFDRAMMADFVSSSSEPAALQYVVEALIDAQDEAGDLPPEEIAHILAIHRTVIDALHAAARAASA